MTSKLFSTFKLRDLEFKNRIVMSPMCQYSAIDGVPNHWHLVHLGSRATGGAALVIAEATGVCAEGRISPADLGLWNDQQVRAFSEITEFIKSQNCISGIQIAHAGRKASTRIPWDKTKGILKEDEGGWTPLAPSAVAYDEKSLKPREMSEADINLVYQQFMHSTELALKAGFQVLELHMAHGYLLNEFLSPITNKRIDQYGGSIENRMRLPLKIAAGARKLWPASLPVFVRISASDWVEGGWTLENSVTFCKELKAIGIDLIDCSSGGGSPMQQIALEPGYQVQFSAGVRSGAGIATGAVGLITDSQQAEDILNNEKADLILLGRELLRDPYWPLHQAKKMGIEIEGPPQYLRAK